MEIIEVPSDLSNKLCFYGKSAILKNENLDRELIFDYVTEPAFGDSLYHLKINGRVVGSESKFRIWARSFFLSCDMRYFIACKNMNDIELFIIDLDELKYATLDDYSLVDKFEGVLLSVRTYRKQDKGPSILESQVIDISNINNWKKLHEF